MIRLIIFDLDGVLVDAREIHYEALNKALKTVCGDKYHIDRAEHLSTYDGRPTKVKLELLTQREGLPIALYGSIWKEKQKSTIEIMNKMPADTQKCDMLLDLRDKGFRIAVATNSIKQTTTTVLKKTHMSYLVDYVFTNEDVDKPKPNSEIYQKIMIRADVSPAETLIVEDSHIGRKAAEDSGAHVLGVKNPGDVTIGLVMSKIESIKEHKPKWQGGDLKVIIPMAGMGSRFSEAGYTFPKPLIEVEGKPMIQKVVENINIDAKHIFIVQREHYEKYNLQYLLPLICDCEIVIVDSVTEGAACTVLLAEKYMNDSPILICNSDQIIDWDSNEFMYSMIADGIDAGILTFKSIHPKWSFAKLDNDGYVSEVAEKKPISDNATTGVYYWAKGSDFAKYARKMIEAQDRTNGEFYVCPVFNHAIKDGKKVKIFPVKGMFGIGTPEDLNTYLER